MALVTCNQFNESQKAQDEEIAKKSSLMAEAILVDGSESAKATALSTGVVTAEKIKQALGEVEVKVDTTTGLTGNGTTATPIKLDLATMLNALKLGGFLGDGLDVVNGKLVVKTESIKDCSETEHLFYAVAK